MFLFIVVHLKSNTNSNLNNSIMENKEREDLNKLIEDTEPTFVEVQETKMIIAFQTADHEQGLGDDILNDALDEIFEYKENHNCLWSTKSCLTLEENICVPYTAITLTKTSGVHPLPYGEINLNEDYNNNLIEMAYQANHS